MSKPKAFPKRGYKSVTALTSRIAAELEAATMGGDLINQRAEILKNKDCVLLRFTNGHNFTVTVKDTK